ncbi:MAG: restriction endonuclease subunit S [Nonlabens sp.]
MRFEYRNLSEITESLNNRRIPLNSKERAKKTNIGLYPYYGANNIMGYIDEYIFDEEILCIAEDGGNWGANSICSYIVNERCWVNNHAHVLKSNGKVSLIYLKNYLNRSNLNKFITGSTRGKLTKTALNKIEIPLPSLADQKRIAQVLSDCEELISKRKESIALLDELVKSTFLEMFGDPALNHKKLPIITVRDLLDEAKYGTSSKAQASGEYPYLRMNNIDYNGNWDFEKLKYIDLSEKDKPKYLLKKGDVVFNRTNSKELVGKTGIYDRDNDMCIAGYLIRLRTKEGINPYYLWAHLNSSYSKQNLFSMCRNIVGMANINAQEIQNFKCLDIPESLGNAFEEIVFEINSLKNTYQNHLQELENLYARLSQDAFKGELDLSGVVLRGENPSSNVVESVSSSGVENGSDIDKLFKSLNYQPFAAALTRIEEEYGTITHSKTFIQKTVSNIQQIDDPEALREVVFKEMPWGMFSKQIAQSLDKNPFLRSVGTGTNKHFEVKANKVLELDQWMQAAENKEYVNSARKMIAIYHDPFINNDLFQIELMNTVLRCIKILETADLSEIRSKMKAWKMKEDGFTNKAEKFSEQHTEAMVGFLEGLGLLQIAN